MKFDKFLCCLLMYSTKLLVLWVFITVSSCKMLLWVWVIVQDVIIECCCQLSRFVPIKYFIVSTGPTCSCLWRYCFGIKFIILTTLAILATVPRQLLKLLVKTCAFANLVSTLHSDVPQLGRLLHQPYIASASLGSTSPGEWINSELNQSVYVLINLM